MQNLESEREQHYVELRIVISVIVNRIVEHTAE